MIQRFYYSVIIFLMTTLCAIPVAKAYSLIRYGKLQTSSGAKIIGTNTQVWMNDGDETEVDDNEVFEHIATNYLINKLKVCDGDDCRLFCTRDEVKLVLRSILPPCSPDELDKEVEICLKAVSNSEFIDVDEFLEAALKNTFWVEAGSLVVKELIFLDCLNEYYYRRRNMLKDDDYNELKEQLSWEGSVVVSLSGKEAHFISAVAASRRGESLMSDADYDALKAELQSMDSWVVNRAEDPLQRLVGLETFMSYLQRSF